MFKKKIEKIEKIKEVSRVKCETCKHYIDKSDAQIVNTSSFWYCSNEYYCPLHKKPYDEWVDFGEVHFYKKLRTDENGVPVGYKQTTRSTPS